MKKKLIFYIFCSIVATSSLCSCASRSYQPDNHICRKVERIQWEKDLGNDGYGDIDPKDQEYLDEFSSYCPQKTRKDEDDYQKTSKLGADFDGGISLGNSLLLESEQIFLKNE